MNELKVNNPKGVMGVHRNNFFDNRKEHIVVTPKSLVSFLTNLVLEQFCPNDTLRGFDPAINDGRLFEGFYSRTPFKGYGCEITKQPINTKHWLIHENYFNITKEQLSFVKPDFVICNPPFNHKNSSKAIPDVALLETVSDSDLDFVVRCYDIKGDRRPKLAKEDVKKLRDILGKANHIAYFPDEIIDQYCRDFKKPVSKFNPEKVLFPEMFMWKIFNDFGYSMPLIMMSPHGVRLNIRQNSPRRKWLQEMCNITSIVSLPLDTFEGVLFHTEILIFNMPRLKAHYMF